MEQDAEAEEEKPKGPREPNNTDYLAGAMLIPEYLWVSRYPIALLVGSGFGLGIRGSIGPTSRTPS